MKSLRKPIKPAVTYRRHLYMAQLGAIVITVMLCALVSIVINISSQIHMIQSHLLSTANMLSSTPSVVESAELERATDECRRFLKGLIEEIPTVDKIELVDENGLCLYHPNTAYVGKESPHLNLRALEGGEDYVDTIIGFDHRRYRAAYAPIFSEDHTIIGYIAVSILYWKQFDTMKKSVPAYVIITIMLLGMGKLFVTTSLQMMRQLLKGYEPEQFSQIYDSSTNVLNNIDEGVIAIDRQGYITTINNLGREILGFASIPVNQVLIQDILPESKLPNVLRTEQPIYNDHLILHEKNLLITHLPLYSNGQLVGAASLFHNAKLMNEMAEQLEHANSLVDTLRAFNHEFMNKLHVILGYLETDHVEEAKNYLLQTSMKSSRSIGNISRTISHQGVAAIIIGKAIRAAELNIAFNLIPESYCKTLTAGVPTNVYVTILGNLLQNSIEELDSGENDLKEIQLTVFIDSDSTYISVLDTGRGMSPDLIENATRRSVSTKGSGRGTGLYLVNSLVNELHGSFKIESEPGEGTVATVNFTTQGISHMEME